MTFLSALLQCSRLHKTNCKPQSSVQVRISQLLPTNVQFKQVVGHNRVNCCHLSVCTLTVQYMQTNCKASPLSGVQVGMSQSLQSHCKISTVLANNRANHLHLFACTLSVQYIQINCKLSPLSNVCYTLFPLPCEERSHLKGWDASQRLVKSDMEFPCTQNKFVNHWVQGHMLYLESLC